MSKPALNQAFFPFVKIIAGLKNTDAAHVGLVVKAAVEGGAPAVDLPADETIVSGLTQRYPELTTFVSALDAETLLLAAKWGVDVIEFGNYDALYAAGQDVTGEWVLSVSKTVMAGLPEGVQFCATLPGHLSVADQVKLAGELKGLGVHLLQIENVGHGFGVVAVVKDAVGLPVILAGSLNLDNLGDAIASGADGFGIGRIVSEKPTYEAMLGEVRALVAKVAPVVAG